MPRKSRRSRKSYSQRLHSEHKAANTIQKVVRKYIKKTIPSEIKEVDKTVPYGFYPSAQGIWARLADICPVAQGVSSAQRIGDVLKVKSLRMNLFFQLIATAGQATTLPLDRTTIRILVLQSKTPELLATRITTLLNSATTIYTQSTITDQLPDNFKQLVRVLADKRFDLSPANNAYWNSNTGNVNYNNSPRSKLIKLRLKPHPVMRWEPDSNA